MRSFITEIIQQKTEAFEDKLLVEASQPEADKSERNELEKVSKIAMDVPVGSADNLSPDELFNKSELEEFEERSAIMEFDGMLPKDQAEHEAKYLILGARQESGLIGSMISELGAVELKGETEIGNFSRIEIGNDSRNAGGWY